MVLLPPLFPVTLHCMKHAQTVPLDGTETQVAQKMPRAQKGNLPVQVENMRLSALFLLMRTLPAQVARLGITGHQRQHARLVQPVGTREERDSWLAHHAEKENTIPTPNNHSKKLAYLALGPERIAPRAPLARTFPVPAVDFAQRRRPSCFVHRGHFRTVLEARRALHVRYAQLACSVPRLAR